MSTTPEQVSNIASADQVIVRPQSRAEERMPRVLRDILSLEDFEPAARRVLPRPIFGYISGGVETDSSLRGNRAAFQELHFCRASW